MVNENTKNKNGSSRRRRSIYESSFTKCISTPTKRETTRFPIQVQDIDSRERDDENTCGG